MASGSDTCIVYKAYCECDVKEGFESRWGKPDEGKPAICPRSTKEPFQEKTLQALWDKVALHHEVSPMHSMPHAEAM